MANYDTVLMTTSLECISHDIQGFDPPSALKKAHSSPLPHIFVAEGKPVSTQARDSFPKVAAMAESRYAGNKNNVVPLNDVSVAAVSPKINEAGNTPHMAIATVGNSPDGTELIQVFRFRDLASEIRNRIYHLILGPSHDPSICLTQLLGDRRVRVPNRRTDVDTMFRTKSVVVNAEHKDPNWGVTHYVKPQDLSILLVSRQIYAEAFHVFYATNCFFFTDTGLLHRFLKNIGYNRRQHLTMVYFLWRGPDAKEAFRLLKTCRRLRTVQFTVPCSHPPGYEALKEVRVENAKGRALVHFAPAQNPPLNIHNHTSCFGDYYCHCLCRRPYEPASNIRDLEKAMMRPRRYQDLPDPKEVFDLFKPRREYFKKSEEQELLQEKASFDDFISKFEQQGKELKYLGRRNKAMEATLNHTLMGSDADDYFRDFADKLAEDKRLLKRKERWAAKQQWEKEEKELMERLTREAKEAKELKKQHEQQMRRAAREVRWKNAREERENAKKEAREARELRRRNAREAKEREKMMAREARAQKKAARDAKGRGRKGTDKIVKGLANASD